MKKPHTITFYLTTEYAEELDRISKSQRIAVAFTKEAAEQAAKDTEWICDNQRIEEVSVWE